MKKVLVVLGSVLVFLTACGYEGSSATDYEHSEFSSHPIVGTWLFLGTSRYDVGTGEWWLDESFAGSFNHYGTDGSWLRFRTGPGVHHWNDNLVAENGRYVFNIGHWESFDGVIQQSWRHVEDDEDASFHIRTSYYVIDGDTLTLISTQNSDDKSVFVRVNDVTFERYDQVTNNDSMIILESNAHPFAIELQRIMSENVSDNYSDVHIHASLVDIDEDNIGMLVSTAWVHPVYGSPNRIMAELFYLYNGVLNVKDMGNQWNASTGTTSTNRLVHRFGDMGVMSSTLFHLVDGKIEEYFTLTRWHANSFDPIEEYSLDWEFITEAEFYELYTRYGLARGEGYIITPPEEIQARIEYILSMTIDMDNYHPTGHPTDNYPSDVLELVFAGLSSGFVYDEQFDYLGVSIINNGFERVVLNTDFILEIYQNGQWIVLSELRENVPTFHEGLVAFPQNYSTVGLPIDNLSPIAAGLYRLTMMVGILGDDYSIMDIPELTAKFQIIN